MSLVRTLWQQSLTGALALEDSWALEPVWPMEPVRPGTAAMSVSMSCQLAPCLANVQSSSPLQCDASVTPISPCSVVTPLLPSSSPPSLFFGIPCFLRLIFARTPESHYLLSLQSVCVQPRGPAPTDSPASCRPGPHGAARPGAGADTNS